MKKRMMMLISCICMLLLTGGCALIDGYMVYQFANRQCNEIKSLEVWSAAENDEWIYHVNYPHFYYGFNNADMGSTTFYDMEQAVDVTEVPEDTFIYLRDYILGMEDESREEDSVFAYRVILYYYDENGEYQRAYVDGYDDFPEDFDLFIDKVNEICGAPYLTGSGSLQEVTPKFLHEVWGVTDEDVPGGTLEDFIVSQELDMKSLTEIFHMQSALDGFYADSKSPFIDPYRATEIREVDSTQAEYDAFVTEFEAKLSDMGYELRESDSEAQDQDYMIRYNNDFYIAKSSELSKMMLREPAYEGGEYQIDLDAHMEGMTMAADFIYSQDGKFILIACIDVDVQEAFVQCGQK